MKLYIILSFLLVNLVVSKSLDFSSFYPSNDYKSETNPPDVSSSTSSNELSESEPTIENISLSSSEYLEVNVSDATVHLSNESASLEQMFSDSTENIQSSASENSTDEDLDNIISKETAQTQSSTKSKEIFSSVPSSSVASTLGNSSSDISLSSLEDIFNSTEETEEVVLGTKPSTFTVVTKTIYQKTIEWVGDTYTLSILIPVAAGVLFAVSIILTIATCRCIRRKCRRRKFRKRVLPDSIKNLRPSDQARLLGDCDSSDEF